QTHRHALCSSFARRRMRPRALSGRVTSGGPSLAWWGLWARLSAVDRMALAYLCLLGSIALWKAAARPTLFAIVFSAIFVVACASLSSSSRLGALLHDFAPVGFVILLFNVSAPVIAAANPVHGDAVLSDLDQRVFGSLVAAWQGALGRPAWLTDLASVAYVSFY